MSDDKDKKPLESELRSTISDKLDKFLKNWIIDIVIVVMLIVYILKSVVKIEIVEKDIWSIIGDCALILVFLSTIKILMLRKGIQVGANSSNFIKAKTAYEDKLNAVVESKAQYLTDYIEIYNERNKRTELTEILSEYGLNYDMYIQSSALELTDLQKCGIKAASKHKSARITMQDLTGKVKEARNNKSGIGMSINEFTHSKSLTSAALTVASVLIFAWFTVSLVSEFSWANVIWQAMQVIVFLIKGTISFVSAYMFMTEDYVNRLIRQRNLLIEFDNTDISVYEERRKVKVGKLDNAIEKTDLKEIEQ